MCPEKVAVETNLYLICVFNVLLSLLYSHICCVSKQQMNVNSFVVVELVIPPKIPNESSLGLTLPLANAPTWKNMMHQSCLQRTSRLYRYRSIHI